MMKAVFLTKFGSPREAFEIRETPKPIPKPHQVLIKVEGFGLNFADVVARRGLYGPTPPLPCVLGYEVVGTIEAQGEEVEGNKVGQRVLALTRFGGYAEYATTDYRAVAEIPDTLSASTALALGTQYTTAQMCFHESLNLYPGDKVLIHAAAGGVGIALCQMALNAGCEVFATAGADFKIEFLKSLGVHHPINYNEKDYASEVKKILGSESIDAAFNSIAGKTIKKDWKLLGSGGKLVVFGAASQISPGRNKWLGNLNLLLKTGFFTPLAFIVQSKSIIGVNMLNLGDEKPQLVAKCLEEVIAQARAEKIKPVVHKEYSIHELHEAHTALEIRKTVGKTAVMWDAH